MFAQLEWELSRWARWAPLTGEAAAEWTASAGSRLEDTADWEANFRDLKVRGAFMGLYSPAKRPSTHQP